MSRRFVFDFETGEIIEKNDFAKRVKETRKVIAKQKRQHNYRKKKELTDELKLFVKELQKDTTPLKAKRKLPKEPRKTRQVVGDDVEHTYTFDFDYNGRKGIVWMTMEEPDDVFEAIKENIDEALALKSIKQLINIDRAFVRFVLYMRNVAYSRNEAEGEPKTISTEKKGSVKEAYDDLKKKLKNYSVKYFEDHLTISKFAVMLRTVNLLNGQGGVSRSIADAEKTWKEVSINTKYNCLYTAVCMSKNKHQYKELMENHELLLNQAKKLKFKLKGRFETNPKHTMSNDIEIQMCSDYLKTPIIVYNNQYMKVREFQPKELPKDKRTSARDALEIRISNGHYTSLIRRKDLTDDDLETQVSKSKPKLKNVDAYLQYEGDNVYEMDAETGLQV